MVRDAITAGAIRYRTSMFGSDNTTILTTEMKYYWRSTKLLLVWCSPCTVPFNLWVIVMQINYTKEIYRHLVDLDLTDFSQFNNDVHIHNYYVDGLVGSDHYWQCKSYRGNNFILLYLYNNQALQILYLNTI